jgi:hypothetical protein
MRKTLLLLSLVVSFGATAQKYTTPDPVVTLGNIRQVYLDGKPVYPTLTVEEILANHPTFNDGSGFRISSYSFSFYHNDRMEVYGPICVKGPEYSPEAKELFRKNAYGLGTVYIDEIKAIGPDGRTRTVNSMTVNFR